MRRVLLRIGILYPLFCPLGIVLALHLLFVCPVLGLRFGLIVRAHDLLGAFLGPIVGLD